MLSHASNRGFEPAQVHRLGEVFREAGLLAAAVAVPLHIDPAIPLCVVRVVAPPLRTNPEEGGHGR